MRRPLLPKFPMVDLVRSGPKYPWGLRKINLKFRKIHEKNLKNFWNYVRKYRSKVFKKHAMTPTGPSNSSQLCCYSIIIVKIPISVLEQGMNDEHRLSTFSCECFRKFQFSEPPLTSTKRMHFYVCVCLRLKWATWVCDSRHLSMLRIGTTIIHRLLN